MLCAELGRHPLEITIKTRIIKFWVKLLTGSNTKISRMCYDHMFSSPLRNKWLTHVKNILDLTGYTYLQLFQYQINLKNAHLLVKTSLQDQFLQTWNNQLDHSSKGITYRMFKHEIKLEPYLTNFPANLRLTLFRFRTDNHRLPVETGRWHASQIPYADRKCALCLSNDIGDTFHYLLSCSFFQQSRIRYIPSKYYRNPNIIKFSDLLASTTPLILKNISYFAREIMNHFNNTT